MQNIQRSLVQSSWFLAQLLTVLTLWNSIGLHTILNNSVIIKFQSVHKLLLLLYFFILNCYLYISKSYVGPWYFYEVYKLGLLFAFTNAHTSNFSHTLMERIPQQKNAKLSECLYFQILIWPTVIRSERLYILLSKCPNINSANF